jgi:hypothetical protein
MTAKVEQKTYEDAVSWLRDHGFDLIEAPGAQTRVFLKKYNCSAAIQKTDDGGAKIFAYPGYMIGSEISKLVNRGYQQFHEDDENRSAGHGRPPESAAAVLRRTERSAGTAQPLQRIARHVSESYHYDRIKDRDEPEVERPKRPWETVKVKAATAAKKSRA